jgi:type I restriction-modification system DNA methylase subunit
MRKYLYVYDSPNMTYRTCKINDLIEKVNMLEQLDINDRLTVDKLHNFFQGKTKKTNYVVSRCMRSRI